MPIEHITSLRLQVVELEKQLAELERLLETAETDEHARAFKAVRYKKLREKFDVLVEIFEREHDGY